MRKQSVESQVGEIQFRKKLVQQQVDGRHIFNDEFDAKGIEKILNERMIKTFTQMTLLKEMQVMLSPYVEIGAERCQRSLIMENDFGAVGAAVDISYDMLKSCDYYSHLFNKSKLPLRVCCDANNLPFMTDSVPFMFCYETLHHFPEPTPVVDEIHRVLAPGGFFFFDEEPYKGRLHIDLYKARKAYSNDSLMRGNFRRIFDYFLAKPNCNEIDHSIIENRDLTIAVWRKALHSFDEKHIKIQPHRDPITMLKCLDSDLIHPENQLKFLIASLLGGNIGGTCSKSGSFTKGGISIHDLLICPTCLDSKREVKLDQVNSSYLCAWCNNKFPIMDSVVFLFSYNKFEELYPEIFKGWT